jgi:hypothetical protein
LSSTAPRPAGSASLVQTIFADDYRGDTVTFRGEFRVRDTTRTDTATRTGLFLRVVRGPDVRRPLTERGAIDDPDNTIVTVSGDGDWIRRQVTVQVPEDTSSMVFGIFLVGPGRIELRNAELTRGT